MSKPVHRFVVEVTSTGYSAYEETESIFTTGSTLDDLLANVQEALALYYEDAEDSGVTSFEVEFIGLRTARV